MVAGVTVLWMVMTPGIVSVLASLPPFNADNAPALRGALSLERVRADAPLVALLLAPTRWVLGPFVAGLVPNGTWAGRLAATAWPLILIVAHNEWVVRSQTRFEEATLERSRRQAAKGDAAARFRKVRQRRRQEAPFTLTPVGHPETAIVWKNLMLAHRTRLVWAVGVGTAAFGVAAVVVGAWLVLQVRVADMPLIAWQLPLLGLTAVIPLVIIVWLLTRFGGVLWDRLDPSAELLGAGRSS